MDGKFIPHYRCGDQCFFLGLSALIFDTLSRCNTNFGLRNNLKCTAVAHKGWGTVLKSWILQAGSPFSRWKICSDVMRIRCRCWVGQCQLQGLTLSSPLKDLRNFWTDESHSLAEKLNEFNYLFTFNLAPPETLHLFSDISLHLFPNLIFRLINFVHMVLLIILWNTSWLK